MVFNSAQFLLFLPLAALGYFAELIEELEGLVG